MARETSRRYGCILSRFWLGGWAMLPAILLWFSGKVSGEARAADADFTAARHRIVEEQIAGPGRGLTNAQILAAMRKVARREFVPASLRAQAYDDHPLPIGHGGSRHAKSAGLHEVASRLRMVSAI